MSRGSFELSTPEPCSQDWAAMSGDLRQRYCSLCAKTVIDLAHLTHREIEVLAMRAAAGDKVCCRITRRSDGELVMKEEPTARSSHRGSVLLSAALAAGLPAAAQGPKMTPAIEVAVAPIASEPGDDSQAIITGRLLKPDGTPVDTGLVYLDGEHANGRIFVVDSLGRFELHAAPGSYDVVVQTGVDQAQHIAAVVLHEGQQSFGDVRTQAGRGDLVGPEESFTAGGMIATVRWTWRSRFRHPVLYARSVVHRHR